jgi:hypothetical protein
VVGPDDSDSDLAGLSYGAFKLFWPHIIGKAGTTTQEKDEPNRRN